MDGRVQRLKQAVTVIQQGGIVAYPTESCFGLGCDPRNQSAVRKLLRLKKRSYEKGLILIAAHYLQLRPYIAEISAATEARVQATWPGFETWILPARAGLSRLLTGRHDAIAVRVTAHSTAAALCRMTRHALVSTSANIPGQAPLRHARLVNAVFKGKIDFILDAPVGAENSPSRIRVAGTGVVVRH